MPFKLGQRVKVLPGTSNCKDGGSLEKSVQAARNVEASLGIPAPEIAKAGVSRKGFEGFTGEVVQIGPDQVHPVVLDVRTGVKATHPSTCSDPAASPPLLLVDNAVVSGTSCAAQGGQRMREWFTEAELEAF
jgi:hypothetical protein